MRFIFLFFSTILFSTYSLAQTLEQGNEPLLEEHLSKFQVGFKIGRSNGTLYGKEVDFKLERGAKLENRIGIDIGFNLKRWIGKFLYTRFEFNYLQRGGVVSGGGFDNDVALYDYINVPIMLGLNFIPRGERLNLALESGVGLNVVFKENQNLKDGLYPGQGLEFSNSNASYNLGFNVEYEVKPRVAVFINYRFYKDFSYFFKRTYTYEEYNPNTNTLETKYGFYDMWHKGNSITIGMMFTPFSEKHKK